MPKHFRCCCSIVAKFILKQQQNLISKHGFPCIKLCQIPRVLLKALAFGLGFKHHSRDFISHFLYVYLNISNKFQCKLGIRHRKQKMKLNVLDVLTYLLL